MSNQKTNQKNKTVAGIDYAMNTPAVCILNGDDTYWMFITDKKKNEGIFNNNIQGVLFNKDDYSSDIERFDKLSDIVMECLIEYDVDEVVLEGYSMGSKSSRTFQIGENTGILKKKLYSNFKDINVVSPNEVKKYATGKGNATKEQMTSAFIGAEDIDLFSMFSMKKAAKPIEDIVDSYFIAHWLKSKVEANGK